MSLLLERDFAIEVIREAADLAMTFFEAGVIEERKAGDEPVTEADRRVNALITDAIARRFPDDAVLAEESPPDPRRFAARRTWMVDPIDGTREFIRGTHGWEIFIGLVEEATPVLGVIVNPPTGRLWEAQKGLGAYVHESSTRTRLRQARANANGLSVALRDRHPQGLANEIAEALGATNIVSRAGFGARALLTLAEDVDIVLSVSGQPKEWDTCALDVLLEEAGLAVRNCLGKPLTYLKDDPTQNDGLVIAPQSLMPRILETVMPIYATRQGEGEANTDLMPPHDVS